MAAARKSLALMAFALTAAAFAAGTVYAGAQKYVNPQFAELTKAHKTIAVLPFKVTINKAKLPKNVTLEMIAVSEKEEATEFQKQLYARFLQRAQEDQYTIGFQDVDQTNALLARAGIPSDSLYMHTKDEIAKALGVDALVSGTVHQAQPTSTGMAMAQSFLLGFSGNTQRVDINMTVHNGADGTLLWSYDHTDKGGLTDSVEGITKSLLKKVAGNFPYRKEKS
jgi:curli biogenesis system outer membrane secretion channel CsgG